MSHQIASHALTPCTRFQWCSRTLPVRCLPHGRPTPWGKMGTPESHVLAAYTHVLAIGRRPSNDRASDRPWPAAPCLHHSCPFVLITHSSNCPAPVKLVPSTAPLRLAPPRATTPSALACGSSNTCSPHMLCLSVVSSTPTASTIFLRFAHRRRPQNCLNYVGVDLETCTSPSTTALALAESSLRHNPQGSIALKVSSHSPTF